MQSLIAGSPSENTGLIQSSDEERQTVEKQPINKWKCAFFALMLAQAGVIVGGGIYGIVKALDSIPAPTPDYSAPCNHVSLNHTQTQCVSTLPSQMWLQVCMQLGATQHLSKKTCVPGCSFNIRDGAGIFTTGSKEETTLSKEELLRFHEFPYDEYQYVICEDNSDSWVHKLKSGLANMSIPFWTTKAGLGAKQAPGRRPEAYNTEGLVLPLEESYRAYNPVVYNHIINGDDTACLQVNHLWCE